MTTEQLVTIDFDSEIAHNNNEIDVNEKNQNSFLSQEIDLIPEVSFKDHNLEDSETIVGESQPLLGGDHHDHITYNQFPGECRAKSIVVICMSSGMDVARCNSPRVQRCEQMYHVSERLQVLFDTRIPYQVVYTTLTRAMKAESVAPKITI
jgi:hypothetical protein